MMDSTVAAIKQWAGNWTLGWDRFWFTPRGPETLAVIRIACGSMLVYMHVIWSSLLLDFMGEHAWIDGTAIRGLHQDYAWSWLWYTHDPTLLTIHQVVAVLVSAMFMVGLWTRVTAPLAWWMMIMVVHRMTLATFGLDQIVLMLTMYLVISNTGSVWSVDAWLRESRVRQRRPAVWWLPSGQAAVNNNIATRLIQLHLCVIYLFGGLSKMRGEMWFDGTALWWAVANYEYQSWDMTWIGHYPWMIAGLTAATIFWETFYPALVWPRLTRPLVLALAVFVHGGIALALGMITFGWMMIVANMAFLDPGFFRRAANRFLRQPQS